MCKTELNPIFPNEHSTLISVLDSSLVYNTLAAMQAKLWKAENAKIRVIMVENASDNKTLRLQGGDF